MKFCITGSDTSTGKDRQLMIEAADEGMPRREKLILRFCLGIPIILFLVFLIYWIGFRDTWEIDNYAQIADRCEALHKAIAVSDDDEASRAYDELLRFIGEHQIKHDFVIERVQVARSAYVPVKTRIEQVRRNREARELAERQRREALAEAEERQEQSQIDPLPQNGQIDWTIAGKVRRSWQDGNFRSADRAEQIAAMIVITLGVEKAISDPLDREATLDYIQRNIDSW